MNAGSIVRAYFEAWETRDWMAARELLADNFSFTSPYDDHIGLDSYKPRCWDSIQSLGVFEFHKVVVDGNDVFVRYWNSVNGQPVHNTEHFVIENGRVQEVTVFFGRA